jgi:hypothetical protein
LASLLVDIVFMAANDEAKPRDVSHDEQQDANAARGHHGMGDVSPNGGADVEAQQRLGWQAWAAVLVSPVAFTMIPLTNTRISQVTS